MMIRKIMQILIIFILCLTGCELPKDDIADYDECNKITGFSVPRRIIADQSNSVAFVMDSTKGIIRVPLYDYQNINDISGKEFALTSSDFIATPKPQKIEGDPTPYVPYDTTAGADYSLSPFDFAYYSNGTKKYLFVLSYCTVDDDEDNAGTNLDGSYYIYKIDITDPKNIPAVSLNSILPINSFITSEIDETYDTGNYAKNIAVDNKAIYIGGNTETPLRVILLDNDGNYRSNMVPDASGDRVTIKLAEGQRTTIDPGQICIYSDNTTDTKILLGERDTSSSGTMRYKFSPSAFIATPASLPTFDAFISSSYFPLSMRVSNNMLFESFYTKVEIRDLLTDTVTKKIDMGSEIAAADTYFTPSNGLLTVLYNYKIDENKYSDFGYDQKFLYSGLRVYDTNSGYNQIKDIKIEGIVKSITVVENNAKYISLSVVQNKNNISVHLIK